MKFKKLEEICSNERKYRWLGFGFTIPFVIMMLILALYAVISNQHNASLMVLFLSIAIICDIFAVAFGRKSDAYSEMAENYVIIKIARFINEYGVDSDNFEIIKDADDCCYKVAFHNQNIDYDDLQTKINDYILEMEMISNNVIEVKLV